ncbi:TPA: hypothetical protein ACYLIB_005632 [Burkholderia cenocepacia]|uniref:hypothetical protein n=1 Tax=Burkholderia cenocepacia TaxID=95486 RepID=UPI001B9D7EB0|nr:hypothetical protein [Burkholderia cenocepacia]MBR8435722.1 hypothetical protein [Burkholderia cenocepacia]
MVDIFSPAVFAAIAGVLDTPTPFMSRIPEAPLAGASDRYDFDLPPDAVREVRAVPALPAPINEGDSDGGECD